MFLSKKVVYLIHHSNQKRGATAIKTGKNIMSYKWRPNASQRRAFAERMKDPEERAAYQERKEARAQKRRAGSQFDYNTAGGEYAPTEAQYNAAMQMMGEEVTQEQREAANMVILAFSISEKAHHDFIHIVNEWRRAHSGY